jgi:hypothetical protein
MSADARPHYRHNPPGPGAISERTVVWDLQHESGGPAEILMHGVDASETLARGRGRYVRVLPAGMKPGPRSGTNRIVHGG